MKPTSPDQGKRLVTDEQYIEYLNRFKRKLEEMQKVEDRDEKGQNDILPNPADKSCDTQVRFMTEPFPALWAVVGDSDDKISQFLSRRAKSSPKTAKFRHFNILMEEELNKSDEYDMEDDDESTDENFREILKEAAWQVVKENPGIDCAEWIQTLIRQFPAEVVDALGTDPYDVHHILTDWWDSEDYTDPDGINETYQGFSEYYYNDLDYLHEQIDKAAHELYELRQALRSRDKEIQRFKNALKELLNGI